MRRALYEHQPEYLMILGTSDNMLGKICHNLWLNAPEQVIRIEDVSTPEERRLAKQTRMTAGQHTIPVPSMEIKHEFSGYFLDPMARLWRRFERDRGIKSAALEHERTVVRPTFSSLGHYSMTDEALQHMIGHILKQIDGIASVLLIRIHKQNTGVIISLEVALSYGKNAQEVLKRTQRRVSLDVEAYTAINVLAVNLIAKRVVLESQTDIAAAVHS